MNLNMHLLVMIILQLDLLQTLQQNTEQSIENEEIDLLKEDEEIVLFQKPKKRVISEDQINLEELNETLQIFEMDVVNVLGQLGNMFHNIMEKQFDDTPDSADNNEINNGINGDSVGNNEIKNGINGFQKSKPDLIILANSLIKKFNSAEGLLHEKISKADLSDPETIYEFGSYALMATAAYKVFSIKKLLKIILD